VGEGEGGEGGKHAMQARGGRGRGGAGEGDLGGGGDGGGGRRRGADGVRVVVRDDLSQYHPHLQAQGEQVSQYLYLCTSKASKLRNEEKDARRV
jgi:hypothetical protein